MLKPEWLLQEFALGRFRLARISDIPHHARVIE
jgi:hypothetical protein